MFSDSVRPKVCIILLACCSLKKYPFGLSFSLRVFSRVVAAALQPLQSQGMKVLPHLDYGLISAPSQVQAAGETAHLLSHVVSLELKIDKEKLPHTITMHNFLLVWL